jgi:predicted CXXCH cytochrome family protein
MSPSRTLLFGIVPLVLCGAALAAIRPRHGFPHEAHERLFPVCEGCHAGMRSGDVAEAYPEPADCALCHDGTRAPLVEWQPRAPEPTNLQFSHAAHFERTDRSDDEAECRTCHAKAGATGRMSVGRAEPDGCLQCHAHRAQTHLAEAAECSRCHVPLATAAVIPLDRVARFPTPPSHDAADFLSAHGPGARSSNASCSVCHARENCERCHANADQLAPVVALSRDARAAALTTGRAPVYPRPATHDVEWALTHGTSAQADGAGCANCHTQPDCTACHRSPHGATRREIAGLPEIGPAGGGMTPAATRRVHAADIVSAHGRAAASGSLECAQCHAQRECATCHAGAESRAFHAANFVERHAMDAFAGGGSCQSCHTAETFCRSCHELSGLSANAAMSASFHDAQPMWVLAHGQAARTSMDMCAACHRQTDCVRCHSAAGGWGVNPHRRGFPASRLAARSAQSCSFCHLGDPGGGD